MADSIFLYKRTTKRLTPDIFTKLAASLNLKGKAAETDEALFIGDGTRSLAFARPCATFAGLLFFADQSVSWGECAEKPVSETRARSWAGELLKKFDLAPKGGDERIRLDFDLEAFQTEAVVFNGKERRLVKAKTDVMSKIALNGVPVVGPRGKVRMIFKETERPVMMHVGLWEGLDVFEERELVREHDVLRAVREGLARRDECGKRPYDIRDVRLVYFADEYRGGPDLLAPEYHVEVEFRDPRRTEKEQIQGPRQVVRLPAYR
ncbi:hypothetical protein [Geobacter sp.]|uniref:hypothetical protein n=1 Tax=Geobacter sp. TaxID=46610 RepID=UPI0026066B3A|nr:hypothetical protein [Geobacter sp.]